jgi:hypothetical protein
VALSHESWRVLVLESSWHDGVAIAAPPLSGVVATFDEELLGSVAIGAGPKRNLVGSARHDAWCAQGARLLGCTCV